MQPVAQIENIQDLYRILTLKRIISRRAGEELLEIAGDRVLKNNAHPTDEEALAFMEEEKQLLYKYASYPTLTEWETMPSMRAGTKWGSTFGVTVLVGELVLQHVGQLHPGFPRPVLQKMLFAILGELDTPTANYLIEPFEKMINFKIERADKREMSDEEKSQYIRRILTEILQSFVLVLDRYGLVEAQQGAAAITPFGKRILLHLRDARNFVDILAAAHTRFQDEKPDLTIDSLSSADSVE